MKRTLKRIAPLRFGILLAIAYTFISLLSVLDIVLTVGLNNRPFDGITFGYSILFAPVMGFIIGFLGAALYNLIVPSIGGIEVEVE